MSPVEREQVVVESREQWRAWLSEHAAESLGVWLVRWKKDSGHPHVEYDDVVEEALAAGWVDSLPRRLDDRRSQLLLTPRKPRSNWSRANKDRVEHLERAGLMTAAGAAVVATARTDGSWSALDDVENLIEPDELTKALDARPAARRHWEAFPRSARRGILEWISNARTDATRQRRVRQTVEDAVRNERTLSWPRAARD